jgi:protein-disulfide isomerase
LTAKELGLDSKDIMALYDRANDKHNTNERVRENWKYGASIGISATPQVVVNGVMIANYPTSAADWSTFLDTLLAPPSLEAHALPRDMQFLQ